ncbi:MAG: hypothetical protein A3B38_00040 [Candidatus Levybacteria bacterium RIFCSPLOWO2_01_FULL_36_13]|nr:MAG: hypothetical protein A3B38_00040 [Candidatus Levybacteria bacterium RIFCSPLOWO2_01_FULL_36_13]
MKKPSKNLPQSKWIEPDDFEFICFNLTREFLTFDEPIPDYSTRNNTLLESSLASPRHTFDKKLFYPTLEEQASILFYSLIKNHPFANGNKRIAVMTLLIFLKLNGKWLKISPLALYRLAFVVANSKPKDKNMVFQELLKVMEKYIISAPN